MEKLKEVVEMKHDLIDWLKRDLTTCCSGLDNPDCIEIAGKVTDMVKDLAEAERNCMEALYYETVVGAMEDGESPRYGYNHNRYASGRYAPKGHGHYTMGYRPYMDQEPYVNAYMHDPDFHKNMMGYSGNGNSQSSGSNSSGGRMGMTDDMAEWDARYGTDFNMYRDARKHYTNSNSPADKEKMDTHAENHMKNTIESMKEIYMAADPEHKKKFKSDLTKLVGEMPV